MYPFLTFVSGFLCDLCYGSNFSFLPVIFSYFARNINSISLALNAKYAIMVGDFILPVEIPRAPVSPGLTSQHKIKYSEDARRTARTVMADIDPALVLTDSGAESVLDDMCQYFERVAPIVVAIRQGRLSFPSQDAISVALVPVTQSEIEKVSDRPVAITAEDIYTAAKILAAEPSPPPPLRPLPHGIEPNDILRH